MTNEKLFNLTDELLEKIEVAKEQAKELKILSGDKDFPFVHIGEKEYVNPKYLPFEYQIQIIALNRFVKEHNIKQEDLNKILSMCKTRFYVLIDVNKIIPNLVQEIKAHKDEKFIPYFYFGLKNTMEKENTIQK
ncbi:MAG: hypothetical protein J6Q13_03510 [Clostridia bacterium]|nr:hypothetical protein [Clostridia bacterium]